MRVIHYLTERYKSVRNFVYFSIFLVYYSILVKVTTIKLIQPKTTSSFTLVRGRSRVKISKAINYTLCNNWAYGVHGIFINKNNQSRLPASVEMVQIHGKFCIFERILRV